MAENPALPANGRETRRETDCLLEGSGFEPSVPLAKRVGRFEFFGLFGERTGQHAKIGAGQPGAELADRVHRDRRAAATGSRLSPTTRISNAVAS